MKNNTTVIANLLSVFPRSEFEKAVKEYLGDHRVRTLGTFDLFKTLLYGQVTSAFSVREIESSLVVNVKKLYQCGMVPVKRTTLCDAMEKRDPRIFQRTFEALVLQAQVLSGTTGKRFRNPLKIIDASTIELCINRCDWATFRSTKGAVKIHVALNGDHLFPEQVRLTTGNVHEVNELSNFNFAPGDIVVMDRGYVDFKRLSEIDLGGSTFVIRMKRNCQYTTVHATHFPKGLPVRRDARIRLDSPKTEGNYPKDIRQIFYHDAKYNRDYVFLTNNFEISAQEVADIYKARWEVELFFKWIKQNLKIKTFLGTTMNAVYTQIWVALILFLLLWIVKTGDGIAESMQRILQILKTTILGVGTIFNLFRPPPQPDEYINVQLTFVGLKG